MTVATPPDALTARIHVEAVEAADTATSRADSVAERVTTSSARGGITTALTETPRRVPGVAILFIKTPGSAIASTERVLAGRAGADGFQSPPSPSPTQGGSGFATSGGDGVSVGFFLGLVAALVLPTALLSERV
ncbi:MAG TPA: hypothetical protein VE780_17255 [Thermoleophilaceae bacterium]|nr:hypothetical protein [Thermoleophilaceae bacterium]